MIVKDNFLTKEEFAAIQKIFLGPEIYWQYNDLAHFEPLDPKHFQFCHSLFVDCHPTSEIYNYVIEPFRKRLNIKSITRVKANLLTKTFEPEKHSFHSDFKNNKTAIFFVNTNNGYTEFKTGEKVQSIGNRLVEFDSNLEHRGVSCTDQKIRVVINFNYYTF
tara:strand:- start:1579 stop:2064 length:486 start_codon:yes stop_codon:yes gene_type:complete